MGLRLNLGSCPSMRLVLLIILIILIRHNYRFYQRLTLKRLLTVKDYVILVLSFILLAMILFAVPFSVVNLVIVILVWMVPFTGIEAQGLTEEGVQHFEGLKVSPELVPYEKVTLLSWENYKTDRKRVIMKIPRRQITQDFYAKDMPHIKQKIKIQKK